MGGGSWGGQGLRPVHPSAWCKADQGWVDVENITSSRRLSIPDVKTSNRVYRLWENGTNGAEYFLLENRQRTEYDGELPGEGLLIWHIDDNVDTNTDAARYKVTLKQADGQRSLEASPWLGNQGDAGDPYPGSANNRTFDSNSIPSSRDHNGQSTHVSVREISASDAVMTATVSVSHAALPSRESGPVTMPQLVSRVERLEAIILAPADEEIAVAAPTRLGSDHSSDNGEPVPLRALAGRT